MAEPVRAIEVIVESDQVDLISGLLWSAGAQAVAEHDLDHGRVLLRTDVMPGGMDTVRGAVGHLVEEMRLVTITDDGLDAWRDHATVTTAGERIVVHPPWVPLGEVAPDAVVVQLDPGRSWGHGAHPTTRLCLAEVERALAARPGLSLLDVGCGSGALSVVAGLLGAASVVACDIDPLAVEMTVANAARNGVADVVDARLVPGTDAPDPLDGIDADLRADLVVANIGAGTLAAMAAQILGRLADGGILVLSGLLDPPHAEVAEAFRPLVVERTESLEGWAALVLSSPRQ